jgi:hypothetical protein
MPPDNDVPTVKPAWMLPIETRQARADYYFGTVLDRQREWYSKGARIQKRRYLAFAICVIVLGALISVLQVLKAEWVPYLTAALGAAVAISRAVDALLRPGETWQAYRKASEGMKREYRLYLNNADVYVAPDEASAYRLLVERVETIIAEEQQLFWQSQAKAGAEQAKGGAEHEPPKPPDQGA